MRRISELLLEDICFSAMGKTRDVIKLIIIRQKYKEILE
jgi:hypothetical protein